MTDRELLEMAARATKYGDIKTWEEKTGKDVDPLENDGDAFRLAVEMGFTVQIHRNRVIIEGLDALDENGDEYEIDEVYRDIFKDEPWDEHNARSATRRSIVRAAAAMGEHL